MRPKPPHAKNQDRSRTGRTLPTPHSSSHKHRPRINPSLSQSRIITSFVSPTCICEISGIKSQRIRSRGSLSERLIRMTVITAAGYPVMLPKSEITKVGSIWTWVPHRLEKSTRSTSREFGFGGYRNLLKDEFEFGMLHQVPAIEKQPPHHKWRRTVPPPAAR